MLRVLVVDDSRDGADTLQVLLSLWGFDPRVAYSGPEGLKVAAEFLPQVVLLDIAMPGMTGWEVARRLREIPGCAGAVLVAITGSTQQQGTQHSLDAGFRARLLKPVEPDELRALLESFRGAPAAAP